jgi:hypothetical protein
MHNEFWIGNLLEIVRLEEREAEERLTLWWKLGNRL